MKHPENTSPMQRVRDGAHWVTERAALVHIDQHGLERLAQALPLHEIHAAYRWEQPYHLSGPPAELIDYVFTVEAVNFGSGFSPLWKAQRRGTTYTAVAEALKNLRLAGASLGPHFARSASPEEIAQLLGVSSDFPLAVMYARSLNELGLWVAQHWGSYAALLQSLPRGRAAGELVALLADNLSCFNDCASYAGREVCFYKRAQILVSELHVALGAGASPFTPAEIADLTCFADNLVPHVLRKEGVLVYDPELLARIERREAIPAGSAAEVEIRAAGVASVERTVCALRRQGVEVFPAMLDVYLWTRGQQQRYKSEPRHLTETFFY